MSDFLPPPPSFGPASHALPPLDGLLARLRVHIATIASERRESGTPLEQVLGEVRQLLHEAETEAQQPGDLAVLQEELARWTRAAYDDGASGW